MKEETVLFRRLGKEVKKKMNQSFQIEIALFGTISAKSLSANSIYNIMGLYECAGSLEEKF